MTEEKAGFFGNIINFGAEVKQEVRKVTWPTRNEMYGGTIVLIVVLIVLCIALGGMDAVMGFVMEKIMAR